MSERDEFEAFRDKRNAQLEKEGHAPGSRWHVDNSHYQTWQAARQSSEAEPIAYWDGDENDEETAFSFVRDAHYNRPLYTRPPARVPDDVMVRIKNLLFALGHQGVQLDPGEPPYDVGDWGAREAQDLHTLLTHQPSAERVPDGVTVDPEDLRSIQHLLEEAASIASESGYNATAMAYASQVANVKALLKQEGGSDDGKK